ncbi:MAG: phage holin family protein [Desulfovibrionales bacterium]
MLMEREELSIKELFRDLTREFQALMKENLDLARLEIQQKISSAGKGATLAGIGGALVYAGLLTLIASAVFALALVLPAWASALIIGAGVCIIGGILLASGISSIKKASTPPEQTMEAIKEEKQWMKHEAKS